MQLRQFLGPPALPEEKGPFQEALRSPVVIQLLWPLFLCTASCQLELATQTYQSLSERVEREVRSESTFMIIKGLPEPSFSPCVLSWTWSHFLHSVFSRKRRVQRCAMDASDE